jgi:hypothetical protein
MTEPDWLSSTDPDRMLDHLGFKARGRKLRLFACACAAHVWYGLHDDRSREAIAVADRYADGLADAAELIAAQQGAVAAWKDLPVESVKQSRMARKASWSTKQAAALACWAAGPELDGAQSRRAIRGQTTAQRCVFAHFLRDLYASPFRPPPAILPAWLTCNGGAVRHIAQALYDEGRFDELPVLADALEEAGCSEAAILAHCRDDGLHVRGCWVVDLLLARHHTDLGRAELALTPTAP